jgi:hypothetical protein
MRTETIRPIAAPAVLLGAALALAGCQHGPDGYPYMGGPDNFGEANRVTMAAQVVDPAPQYDTAMADSSVERYRTDKVKKPDKVRTSTLSTGGGGGGGGGN